MRFSVLLTAAIALMLACGDGSGPLGLDPIVLVENQQGIFPASITWWDQSGKVQSTILPSHQTTCVKFVTTTATDSARFVITLGDTTGANGAWAKQWSPWFDPKTGLAKDTVEYPHGAEFWTLTLTDGPGILMKPVAAAPC